MRAYIIDCVPQQPLFTNNCGESAALKQDFYFQHILFIDKYKFYHFTFNFNQGLMFLNVAKAIMIY